MHCSGRDCHFLSVHPFDTRPLTGEDLHCKCCSDVSLEATMAHVYGERAPAFTSEELEKLVNEVLPQYTLLYGPPDKQVSAHQKKDVWRAITKDVRTLGVQHRRSARCCKRWEDIRRWSKKAAEAQLGMASQRGRGARRTMTPLMFRFLAVAYLELDGRLRASQQPQGDSGASKWLPILLTEEDVPDNRGLLYAARPGFATPGAFSAGGWARWWSCGSCGACAVNSEEEEAEEEDVDNRNNIIMQYF
ncbi:hypothetical protein NDU88_003637 [Pleurodeles waltl]|uniref:Myb/SANT-like DNA-binding domain-containing protein n=1 Tax=Pleurodeles waltl TaxID=8319 RepID=A0AAV7REU3_PLEWA|nr:hypothetical protein NDU88_003637 [Pleurodeles waltl]